MTGGTIVTIDCPTHSGRPAPNGREMNGHPHTTRPRTEAAGLTPREQVAAHLTSIVPATRSDGSFVPLAEATLDALRALARKHREALERRPEYAILTALEDAATTLAEALGHGDGVVPTTVHTTTAPRAPLSHMAAAKKALNENGRPMPIRELIAAMEALGVHVGGKKPASNLGSALCAHGDFQSLDWEGGKAWWLAEVPLPKP